LNLRAGTHEKAKTATQTVMYGKKWVLLIIQWFTPETKIKKEAV
jgi:hypothetical protein